MSVDSINQSPAFEIEFSKINSRKIVRARRNTDKAETAPLKNADQSDDKKFNGFDEYLKKIMEENSSLFSKTQMIPPSKKFNLLNQQSKNEEELDYQKPNENILLSNVKTAISAFSFSVAQNYCIQNLTPTLNSLGLCFTNFLSQKSIAFISKTAYVVGGVNGILSSLIPSNPVLKIFTLAALEEVEFRWFVQKYLLHKFPQKIIEKFCPEYSQLMDSTTAKISRIAAASLLFTVMHTHALGCAEGGGVPQLIAGLAYGTLYEFGGASLTECIGMHFFHNLLNSIDIIKS